MTEKERFLLARCSLENDHLRYNIGTYKERSQHMILKLFYEPDIAYHEVPFEGYVADILNQKGIIEIQTAAFRSLNEKMAVFLQSFPVTVVFPVAEKKRVVWTDPETGETEEGVYRTYPKSKYKILSELLSVVDHFGDRNFCVHMLLLKSTQCKMKDGYGKDKKKKATKTDTVPDELMDRVILNNADDIRAMLPFDIGSRLTTAEISSALGLRRVSLWRAVKFLTITEILAPVGKKGNSIIYEVSKTLE